MVGLDSRETPELVSPFWRNGSGLWWIPQPFNFILGCCFDELFVAAPDDWIVFGPGLFVDGGGGGSLYVWQCGVRVAVLRHLRGEPGADCGGFFSAALKPLGALHANVRRPEKQRATKGSRAINRSLLTELSQPLFAFFRVVDGRHCLADDRG